VKIAILGSRGVPSQYSGIEKGVEEVSRRLVSKGHEVTVYCRSGQSAEVYHEGVRLIHLPTWQSKNFGTFVHVFLATLGVIFSEVDVVHYHALGPSFFSWLPRMFGKKVVVTIHALDWQRKKWRGPARIFLNLCQWSAIYFPQQTIVVSKTLKVYFEERFKKCVHYIPNGAGPVATDILPVLRSVYEKDRYVLFVGRLVPEKGIQYLLQAFKHIHTDMPLILAGESSFTDDYVSSLRKMSDPRVHFLGFIGGHELESLYKNAYLIVLPSEIEGAPLVLLEAMYYGKCVLSSDLLECREILGSCGVHFRSQDPFDLKEKLEYLLTAGQVVQNFGKKAKERGCSVYNWDSITNKIEDIYLTL